MASKNTSLLTEEQRSTLPEAIEEYIGRGNNLPDVFRQQIGPLGHDHINLVGNYDFHDGQQYSLHKLRPLRSVSEIEIGDEEDIEAYVALSGLYEECAGHHCAKS